MPHRHGARPVKPTAPALWPVASPPTTTRAPRTGQRRLIVPALVVLGSLGIAALVGSRSSVLYRLATRVIVVDDALEPADFIYVLNGNYGERAMLASRLYLDGLAPSVRIPSSREMYPARPDRAESTLSDFIAELVTEHGVPKEAVAVVPYPGGAVNTQDEAEALRLYVEARPARSVIVVTTDYHTGRARRTIRRELRGLGIQVQMAAAPGEGGITPFNWWESEEGRRVYQEELLKQVAVLFGVTG